MDATPHNEPLDAYSRTVSSVAETLTPRVAALRVPQDRASQIGRAHV